MNKKKIPYKTIQAACVGDPLAVQAVLRYYAGYIRTLSTVEFTDPVGNRSYSVDYGLMQALETKLLTKILCFDATVEPYEN